MEFRIADTFTDSLAKLKGEEQRAAKTTAFDLKVNPANPGMQFHKLNKRHALMSKEEIDELKVANLADDARSKTVSFRQIEFTEATRLNGRALARAYKGSLTM